MADIPEHIVERVAAAINESARMPGYLDAPFTRKEARILARAAIKVLGGGDWRHTPLGRDSVVYQYAA